jgi:hypothetical protein
MSLAPSGLNMFILATQGKSWAKLFWTLRALGSTSLPESRIGQIQKYPRALLLNVQTAGRLGKRRALSPRNVRCRSRPRHFITRRVSAHRTAYQDQVHEFPVVSIRRNCGPNDGLSISQSVLWLARVRLPPGNFVPRSARNAFPE